ncbi:hypothetical protein CONCODRAFT_12522, partial [Conidiobolus coronatus NRRL 28638]
MIIKIWSIAFISFTRTPIHKEQSENSYLDSKWIDSNFSDIEKVEEWEQLSNRYIDKLENNQIQDITEPTKFSLIDLVAPIFTRSNSSSSSSCRACEVSIKNAHRLTKVPFSRKLLLKILLTGCKRRGIASSECDGMVAAYGSVYLDVIHDMDFGKPYMGQLACFHLLRVCPHPELPDAEWNLPAPKKISAPQPSGKELKILHLSDLHYDSNYIGGTEADCRRTICCQKDSIKDENSTYVIKAPASKWGEY